MGNEPRPSRHPGVRLRVTALATVIVAIVLALVSVLLVARQRAALTEDLDEMLTAEAQRIAGAWASSDTIPPLSDDDQVALVTGDGSRVVATTDEQHARRLLSAALHGDRTIELDGAHYRIASARLGSASDGRVIVAAPDEDVDESIAKLIRSLLWLIPPAVLALLVLVWWLVGRTLQPVERIRAEVASIDVDELARRVPVPRGDDEIARLARTMNSMLERLETSVRRQQRFVADASHELRTPLARMRVELEVDARDPASADVDATRRSQLDEIAGMQRMIDDLLMLARADAGAAPEGELVDLDDIVLDEAHAIGATPGPPIDLTRVSAAQVVGSGGDLRRVVRNLLDNARRHARSRTAVSLTESDGWARLTVDDDGPGIPTERRQEVFERFTRLDAARTGVGHVGLGLAIVAEVVARHGGRVTVGDTPSGGARFTVVLPGPGSAPVTDITQASDDGTVVEVPTLWANP